ncbi:sensor histidine kinase [Paenibacillus sp. FSL H8-0548]|uniref:sensor histidine kinase n=1 Tax=Paenibacillus sp. FSL H8-0548 TaxID=1920422 RepID=UPI0015C39573|nr:sensor histidine kinase [Paenibacillus sp. FSL H8-0548]
MNKAQFSIKNISISYILIFSLVFISTVPVIFISIQTYYKNKEIIYSNTEQYIIQMLKQTNGEVELKLEQFSSDASFLVNPTVQQMMNEQMHQELTYQQKKNLSLEITQFNVASPKLTEILVYSITGKFLVGLTTNLSLENTQLPTELMDKASKLDARIYWGYAGTDGIHETSVQGVRMIKNMLGPEVTSIGFLSFKIPEALIYDSIAELKLGKTGQVIIVDGNDNILSSQNRDLIGKNLHELGDYSVIQKSEGAFTGKFDGRDNFIAFHRSSQTGWKTMSFVPIAEMTPGMQDVYKSIFLYHSLWIVISIVLSLIITRTVATPIKKLIRAMRAVESGNFGVQMNLTGNKEVIILSGSFNKMTSRLKELISRVYEEELKEKNAQLRALQAQINPHFLYNTLDTIYWMLYVRGQEKIGDLIVALSNMLRYSIGKNGPVVPLKVELDNLFNYTHILSTRFGERITFDFDIDESLLQTKTLKLMLQPILENAITHGLEPSGKPGIIKIRVYRDDDQCLITISDNGIGISKEKLEEYQERRQINHGLGIQNVDERLRLTFGEKYALTITSVEGEGTTILFRLPDNQTEG